jgi:hypothetical protein
MASKAFKSEMTRRFGEVVKYLMMSGVAQSKTEISWLIEQPLQVVSKLLNGERIITMEQTQKLILNTQIDAHWFLTGEGSMLKNRESSDQDSGSTYRPDGSNANKIVSALLPLVTDLEDNMELLKKENREIKAQLKELMDRYNNPSG